VSAKARQAIRRAGGAYIDVQMRMIMRAEERVTRLETSWNSLRLKVDARSPPTKKLVVQLTKTNAELKVAKAELYVLMLTKHACDSPERNEKVTRARLVLASATLNLAQCGSGNRKAYLRAEENHKVAKEKWILAKSQRTQYNEHKAFHVYGVDEESDYEYAITSDSAKHWVHQSMKKLVDAQNAVDLAEEAWCDAPTPEALYDLDLAKAKCKVAEAQLECDLLVRDLADEEDRTSERSNSLKTSLSGSQLDLANANDEAVKLESRPPSPEE
jgi:hypothetical protein